MILVHDPKYNRVTSFQSNPSDFNMKKLIELQAKATKLTSKPCEFPGNDSDSEDDGNSSQNVNSTQKPQPIIETFKIAPSDKSDYGKSKFMVQKK